MTANGSAVSSRQRGLVPNRREQAAIKVEAERIAQRAQQRRDARKAVVEAKLKGYAKTRSIG